MGEENCSDFFFLYGKIHVFLDVKRVAVMEKKFMRCENE